MQDMWEKFMGIGTLRLIDECSAVCTAASFPTRPAFTEFPDDGVRRWQVRWQGVDAPRY